MRNLSKFIAFVFLITHLLQNFAFAQSESITNEKYSRAINFITALNIIDQKEEGDAELNREISKGEFAAIATRLLGLYDTINELEAKIIFSDVSAQNENIKSIAFLAEQGIISGDSFGRFYPEQTITIEQAAKVLVCILGFDFLAMGKGGYPTGFITVASEKGVLTDVDAPHNAPITKAIAAQMAYNTLNAEMLAQNSYGKSNGYVVEPNKTLLTENLGIEQVNGIIKANYYTYLTRAHSGLKKNDVDINGVIYDVGTTNAGELLGYKVLAYYRQIESREKPVLIYIEKDARTEVTTIKAEDIVDFSNNTIYYRAQQNIRQLKINQDTDVIFNGMAYPEFLDSDLKPTAGELIVINQDSGNFADVVIVKSYENYVVDGVTESDRLVLPKNNKQPLELEQNNSDYEIIIKKNDRFVDIGVINEWDILSVMESKNTLGKKLKTVHIESSIVEGIVSEHNPEFVIIDNHTYELAQSYKDEFLSPASGASTIKAGEKAIFYLDIEGKIAAVNTSAEHTENYGYLLKISTDNNSIGDKAEFKILNAQGELIVLSGASRISLNGATSAKGWQVATSEPLYQNNQAKKQLIIYETNAEDEIIEIHTESADENAKLFSNPRLRTGLVNYKSGIRLFGDAFRAAGNALVFQIPVDVDNDEDYSVESTNIFVNDGDYDVQGFNISEARVAPVLVYYHAERNVSGTSSLVLVDKISLTTNDNGETVHKLYALEGGTKAMHLAANTTVLAGLKTGDIIQYDKNFKNEIVKISLRFDINTSQESLGTAQALSQFIYGTIIGKVGTDICVDTAIGDQASGQSFSIAGKRVYIFDSASQKISTGTVADIYKGAQIFARARYGDINELVIIKR